MHASSYIDNRRIPLENIAQILSTFSNPKTYRVRVDPDSRSIVRFDLLLGQYDPILGQCDLGPYDTEFVSNCQKSGQTDAEYESKSNLLTSCRVTLVKKWGQPHTSDPFKDFLHFRQKKIKKNHRFTNNLQCLQKVMVKNFS